MGVAIIVMPCLFVQVRSIPRCDALERGLQVSLHEPRLEFRCRDAAGGPDDKHRGGAILNPSTSDATRDFVRDVDDVVVPASRDLYLVRFNSHRRSLIPGLDCSTVRPFQWSPLRADRINIGRFSCPASGVSYRDWGRPDSMVL